MRWLRLPLLLASVLACAYGFVVRVVSGPESKEPSSTAHLFGLLAPEMDEEYREAAALSLHQMKDLLKTWVERNPKIAAKLGSFVLIASNLLTAFLT